MRSGDDRIDGSVPVWESRRADASGAVEARLSNAADGSAAAAAQPQGAMAYAEPAGGRAQPQEFGFADLLDMVNPLQHIPLVSDVYRRVTGDTIRPISTIVGGALYGGFVGAAMGVGDAIVQYETGKNTADNMMALVTEGKGPSFRPHPEGATGTPEQRLNEAARVIARNAPQNDLPGTTMAFADMKQGGSAETATQQPITKPNAAFVSASYAANAAPYGANVPQPRYND
jgi:hypothetical protein